MSDKIKKKNILVLKKEAYLRYHPPPSHHIWELLGNHPVFVVMVVYSYVERIGYFSSPPFFCITCMLIKIYYPGEPVNIHINQ